MGIRGTCPALGFGSHNELESIGSVRCTSYWMTLPGRVLGSASKKGQFQRSRIPAGGGDPRVLSPMLEESSQADARTRNCGGRAGTTGSSPSTDKLLSSSPCH